MCACQRLNSAENSGYILHSGLSGGAGLGLFSPTPMGTWARGGKTLWDQSVHADERRELPCWTTASSSTGICSAGNWSCSLQTMKERWSQTLRTCNQRGTKTEMRFLRTCWYQPVYFILTGCYWLAAFLGFAIKPSLEDWKFRKLIIIQNFPENVHV